MNLILSLPPLSLIRRGEGGEVADVLDSIENCYIYNFESIK